MPMQRQFATSVVTKKALKTAAKLTLKNAKSVARTKVPLVAVRNNFQLTGKNRTVKKGGLYGPSFFVSPFKQSSNPRVN
jgi:hypothetical protein